MPVPPAAHDVVVRLMDGYIQTQLLYVAARLGLADLLAAILIPAAFFLSVISPTATQPNGLINLAYVGALTLAGSVLSLGVGLIRAARRSG
jgi:hypothetical protein